jgi:hypothetical protein
MTIYATLGDFSKAVCAIAGRGIIHEGFGIVTVHVPMWRQQQVDKALEWRRPLGVRVVVLPLTFWQHLTLWDVRVLIDVTVN